METTKVEGFDFAVDVYWEDGAPAADFTLVKEGPVVGVTEATPVLEPGATTVLGDLEVSAHAIELMVPLP